MTITTPEATVGERVPTEFAPYWEAIERPVVKRARAAARRLLGFDLVPDERRVLDFAHGYYDADPTVRGVRARPRVARPRAPGDRRAGVPAPRSVGVQPRGRDDPTGLHRELDRQTARAHRRLRRRHGAQPIHGDGPLLDRYDRTGRTRARRPGPWHRDPRADHARVRPPPATRAPGMEPRRVGRADQPIGNDDPAAVLQPHDRLPAEDDRAPHNARRDRRDDAPVALHRPHHGSPTAPLPHDDPRGDPTLEHVHAEALPPRRRRRPRADRVLPPRVHPHRRAPWRKRIRDEINYRAQLGYTGFFLPPGFYRRYDMPHPWPWALHALLQFPANFAASTAARHNRIAAHQLDRYQRWRRETWWRNEMGDKQSHFQAAESFRR